MATAKKAIRPSKANAAAEAQEARYASLIMQTFGDSPQLRSLPLAARALWLELQVAMWSGGRCDLQFGPCRPTVSDIATLAGTSDSEVDLLLEPIVACGLLTRRDDGVLCSPLLASLTSRSDINRRNALAGVAKRRSRVGRQSDLLSLAPAARS